MNVVLVVANGWNTGWLGCYGNEWLQTPALDKFAAESIVYDRHFAIHPAPTEWTTALDLTGIVDSLHLTDSRHGSSPLPGSGTIRVEIADDAAPGQAILDAVSRLPSMAGDKSRLLIVETDRLLPPWSVSLDYFDKYIESISRDEGDDPPLPWDEPPIGPADLSDREIERVQATYAAVVSEWDNDFNSLLQAFDRLLGNPVVVVTAGHGQSLTERGWVGPLAPAIHDEIGRVPLIVRFPDRRGGSRVPYLTANRDVMPSIRYLLNPSTATPPIHLPGYPYLVQSLADGSRSLQTDEWTLVCRPNDTSRLYRKPEDRWEMQDLRTQHLEWAEYLETLLLECRIAAVPPALADYRQIVHGEETADEYSPTDTGNDREPEGAGDLRGHQDNEED